MSCLLYKYEIGERNIYLQGKENIFLFELIRFVINVKNNLKIILSGKPENVQRNWAADLEPVVICFVSLRPFNRFTCK